MAIPDKIRIALMEDLHTEFIGRTENGKQFLGLLPFVYSQPIDTIPKGAKLLEYQRNYAVLHVFDEDGNLLYTNHMYGGTRAESDEDELSSELLIKIAELGEVEYTDVEVRLFQTYIEGFMFGFEVDQEAETVTLMPSNIMFMEPWDGGYYT